jgi:hypothetical protein
MAAVPQQAGLVPLSDDAGKVEAVRERVKEIGCGRLERGGAEGKGLAFSVVGWVRFGDEARRHPKARKISRRCPAMPASN